MQQPRCDKITCAANRYNPAAGRNECTALEQCLLTDDYCPFFKSTDQARSERAMCVQRAEKYSLLAPDGTYKQQRFVHAKRVPDADGIPQIVTMPNYRAWLEDLAEKGSIPTEIVTQYKAANPD